MCVSDHTSDVSPGIAEERFLESWLAAVALRGRAGKTVTVPHAITRLPCGCSREYKKAEARSSSLLYPVDREFQLRQFGRSNAWVHLGCANSEAVIPADAVRPALTLRPPRRLPVIDRVDPSPAVPYCPYCGQQGHWERDCPHIGT